MNSKHIGFDCDGVLRKLHSSAFKYFFKENPDLKKYFRDPPVPTSWKFRSVMKKYDEEVYNKFESFVFENVKTSYKVYRNADPFDDADEFSRYYNILKKMGFKVSICTSQKKPWQRIATVQWLEDHIKFFDNIIIVDDKKNNFGLDYLIDDRWENIADIEKEGNTGVLLKRKWNKNVRNRIKYSVNKIEEYVDFIVSKEMN